MILGNKDPIKEEKRKIKLLFLQFLNICQNDIL